MSLTACRGSISDNQKPNTINEPGCNRSGWTRNMREGSAGSKEHSDRRERQKARKSLRRRMEKEQIGARVRTIVRPPFEQQPPYHRSQAPPCSSFFHRIDYRPASLIKSFRIIIADLVGRERATRVSRVTSNEEERKRHAQNLSLIASYLRESTRRLKRTKISPGFYIAAGSTDFTSGRYLQPDSHHVKP